MYGDKLLQNFAVKNMMQLSTADWRAFRETVVTPNVSSDRKRGRYAVSVRKRSRHCQAEEVVGVTPEA
jgi:hypothetical protein